MFTSEIFRNFIYSIANLNAEQLMERYGGFRGFGFASSVTYDLAFLLSMPLIFISYLMSYTNKNTIYYIFSWIIIFAAIIMTGRTGWLGVAFSLLFFLLNIKKTNTLYSILKFIVLLFILISSVLFILSSYYPKVYSLFILSVVPYGFEMFINFYAALTSLVSILYFFKKPLFATKYI